MKLVFTKESNGDIKSQIHTGTVLTGFSYTEMVKQLLQNNTIEEPDFIGIEAEEESKIREMLEDISSIFVDRNYNEEDSGSSESSQ